MSKKLISTLETNELLEDIRKVVVKKEMTSAYLDKIIKPILKIPLSQHHFGRLFQTLMPSGTVSSLTVRIVFAWILTSCPTHPKKKSLLQWVLAALRCRMISVASIQHLHSYFVRFLDDIYLVDEGICLLYITTNADNLTEKIVLDVLRRRSIVHCEVIMMDALIKHFKKLMPQSLPDVKFDVVPNHSFADDNLNDMLASGPADLSLSDWKTLVLSYKSMVFTKHMPAESLSEQLSNYLRLKNSSSSMISKQDIHQDIFAHPMYFVFIAASSIATQQQIIDYLQVKLMTSIDQSGVERPEEKQFFKLVHRLQLMYAQGLPCVQEWLATVVPKWDGQYYQNEIFKLMEGWVLTDFSEFYSHILWHLYEISKHSDATFARIVIRTMSRIVYNNHLYSRAAETILCTPLQKKPCLGHVKRLVKAIDHMCSLMLSLYSDDAVLLHTIIDHYGLMVKVEQEFETANVVMVPRGIVQKIFVNSDLTAIDSVSHLLNEAFHSITASSNGDYRILYEQFHDIYHILFADVAKSGIFSADYHDSDVVKPSKMAKYATRIMKNIAFYGHTTMSMTECTTDDDLTDSSTKIRRRKSDKAVLMELAKHYEAFTELLATMKSAL